MQRQFTLEFRVDYADKGKNDAVRKLMAQLARHGYATLSLLADNGMKPQVACFSDDYFDGHQDIALLEDVIQQGAELLGDSTTHEEPISSELMQALQESK